MPPAPPGMRSWPSQGGYDRSPAIPGCPRPSPLRRAGITIHEERVIAAEVPAGSRFKGYEDFLVQDLVLRPHVVRLRRERWLTPDGRTVVAPMPAGIVGHFGPELRRFVLVQYHQGQVRPYVRPVPRLLPLAIMGVRLRVRHQTAKRAQSTVGLPVSPELS